MSKKKLLVPEDIARFVRNQPVRDEAADLLEQLVGEPRWKLQLDVRRAGTRHVAVVAAAAEERWQVATFGAITRGLLQSGLSWDPLIPKGELVWEEQLGLLAEVLWHKREYDGAIVMIPMWSPDRIWALWQFAADFEKPVIAVDHNPPPNETIPPNVSFVSVSDIEGGKLAARALLKLPETSDVLIMGGMVKPNRLSSCQAELRGRCNVTVTCDGGCERGQAYDESRSLMLDALHAGRPFHAAYASSDGMGAGVLDASEELAHRYGCPRLAIVTYDGLGFTRDLIEQGKIAATIVQDTNEVAGVAVEELANRLYGLAAPRDNVGLPGRLLGRGGRKVWRRQRNTVRDVELAGAMKAMERLMREPGNESLVRECTDALNEELRRKDRA